MKTKAPKNPAILEVHAFAFLNECRAKYKRQFALADIPMKEWEAIAAQGFSYVWLMGVWERSPESRRQCLTSDDLKKAFTAALPDWTERNVIGSPYAVKSYTLDRRLGLHNDLIKVRRKMNEAGLRLILDFVPNHLAMDHAWIKTPDRFVRGSKEDHEINPGLFFGSP